MKRLLIFLLLILSIPAATTLSAQNRTVKGIRQLYSEAQQQIAMMNEEEHLCVKLVSTSQYNTPGAGIRKETVTSFFHEYAGEDEESGLSVWSPVYLPFFLTRKYNIGDLKFYEEYLFDAETGTLLFAFLQRDNSNGGGKDETRYYFDSEEKLSEIIKGSPIAEFGEVFRIAEILRTAACEQIYASLEVY